MRYHSTSLRSRTVQVPADIAVRAAGVAAIELLESRRLLAGVSIEDRVVHVDGTGGNDVITTGGGLLEEDDELVVTLNGQTFRIDEEDFDSVLVRGLAGNDSFEDQSGYGATFEGGDGNDSVVTHSDERLRFTTVIGGAGDDVVRYADTPGIAAPVSFDGGPGRDRMIREQYIGTLDLRNHPTVEDAEIEQGTLHGNSLNNHLTARFDSTFLGHAGNDHIVGSDGDDTLDGGDGNDTLDGGFGGDVLQGGSGLDTVDYSSRVDNLGIAIDGVANDGERVGSGPPTEGDNVMTDVETVLAGSGNDWVFGNGLNNLFRGNGGNDFLGGFGGNDALYGGGGNDRLEGGNGNDYLEGNSGKDALLGEVGTDFFAAGDGDDWLYSRDSITETVNGGNGFDRAQRDASDNVISIEAFLA